MALLASSSSCSQFLHPPPNSLQRISRTCSSQQAIKSSILNPMSRIIVCADEQTKCNNALSGKEWNRREVLLQLQAVLVSSAALPLAPALASESNLAAEKFRIYTDEANMFTISIPQDWLVGRGEGDGVRAVIAFYPQEASSSNVSIVITGLGADFTRLGSFGKVDEFAETLVSGLDRSWKRPPGVAAKLLDSKAANGLYYIEYTLKNPGESTRNLVTALGISNNGFYNRLYTLTGQFFEEEEGKFGGKIRKVVSSFRLN